MLPGKAANDGTNRFRVSRSPVLALVMAIVGFMAAESPMAAEAGIKGKAKRATKKEIKERGGQPVKISCRKTKNKGVVCKWTYAELVDSGSVRNCKGSTKLRRKRGKVKFKQRGCKPDRGAGSVMANLPGKLLKEGFEATSVFCYTTLGDGYKCKWEALRFNASSIERCGGDARSKNRNVTIKLKRCSVDSELTAAQAAVSEALANQGLDPGQVDCRPGSPIKCDWTATRSSGGWTYSCSGTATGTNTGQCDLSAPKEAPLGPVGPHPILGVNEGWPNYRGDLTMLRNDLDAETARFTVSWESVDRGPTAPRDWFFPDLTYDAMVAAGLKPTIILTGAPCWAVDSGEPCSAGETDHPPSVANLGEWAAYVAEAAARYPDALGFEIWNEANLSIFFHGAPRPNRYAKVLEVAYDAIKGVDPNMPVITTGLSPIADSGATFQRYDEFLRDIYEAGIKGHYDAIGHHGYSGQSFDGEYELAIRFQLADLKDVMLDFGEEDTDIWITETGISSVSEGYTESQQATALLDFYRQYRRIPGVPVVIVHRWRDDDAAGGIFAAERGYGLRSGKGAIKPVYCALSSARGAPKPAGC